jgi:signal transduction histidine kinase
MPINISKADGTPPLSAGLKEALREGGPAGLERHLAQLDRLATLGTISAGLAHEVKNALVPVKTFVDLLLESNSKSELAEIVRREMNRIESIISHMLRYAGPDRGVVTTVGLHGMIDHAIRLLQPQLNEKSIAVKRALDADPDLIEANELQLVQAIINLVLNAIEAMAPYGELTLMTQRVISTGGQGNSAEANILMSIHDTGPGIPNEDLPRVFQPFFTTKSQGTGLGLHITRRIIQEHGGVIAVESQPRQGTTFKISLRAVSSVPAA